MQAPESFPPERGPGAARRRFFGAAPAARSGGFWLLGERLARLAGLVLALSAFMSWYSGSDDGPTIAVIGWHVGILGKLVFLVGLAVIALGSVGTTFVLIRLISVPDEFFPYTGRGIGIWISLLSGLAVIAAGLLEASEEL